MIEKSLQSQRYHIVWVLFDYFDPVSNLTFVTLILLIQIYSGVRPPFKLVMYATHSNPFPPCCRFVVVVKNYLSPCDSCKILPVSPWSSDLPYLPPGTLLTFNTLTEGKKNSQFNPLKPLYLQIDYNLFPNLIIESKILSFLHW